MTTENLEKVKLLARDLREGKEFPRSPRATLGGYVLAARAVDKCRATLVGTQGDYIYGCPMDRSFLSAAGIGVEEFKQFVGTGVSDEEIDKWIRERAPVNK